jgi:hypothetical protein
MTPITQTYDGKSYTFSTTLAVLNTVLTADALSEAFRPDTSDIAAVWLRAKGPIGGPNGFAAHTQSQWANTLAASPPAAMSQVPVSQIRAVIAAALAGGGLTTEQPVDTAERIHKNQNSRDVDLLAAAIVLAAIAAG